MISRFKAWRNRKRQPVMQPGPFRPEQVLSHVHLNLIVARLEALEKAVLSR